MGRRARARGDEGAVLVEAGIATLLFITVLFGVIEFGTSFFDYLTTANMTRAGARTGATMGQDLTSDYQILQKIKAAASSMPTANIQFIVVYKAASSGAPPTASCLTGSQTNVCNRYTAADFSKTLSQFGCDVGDPDLPYCPNKRKIGAGGSPTTGPPDYLGVYIKVVHPAVTGMFGSSFTFTDQTVIRVEAQTP
jgi:hypothetical protein